jgi:isocitrate/isopropylmalate dehydrogenase
VRVAPRARTACPTIIQTPSTPNPKPEPRNPKPQIEFKDALIGGAALDACDDPFPDATYQQMKASDSVMLAAIGGESQTPEPPIPRKISMGQELER